MAWPSAQSNWLRLAGANKWNIPNSYFICCRLASVPRSSTSHIIGRSSVSICLRSVFSQLIRWVLAHHSSLIYALTIERILNLSYRKHGKMKYFVYFSLQIAVHIMDIVHCSALSFAHTFASETLLMRLRPNGPMKPIGREWANALPLLGNRHWPKPKNFDLSSGKWAKLHTRPACPVGFSELKWNLISFGWFENVWQSESKVFIEHWFKYACMCACSQHIVYYVALFHV